MKYDLDEILAEISPPSSHREESQSIARTNVLEPTYRVTQAPPSPMKFTIVTNYQNQAASQNTGRAEDNNSIPDSNRKESGNGQRRMVSNLPINFNVSKTRKG